MSDRRASEDFIESVDETIAEQVRLSVARRILWLLKDEVTDPRLIAPMIGHAIIESMRAARSMVAERRAGDMDFDQAMEAMRGGSLVARPTWRIGRALSRGHEDGLTGGFRHRGEAVIDCANNWAGGPEGSYTYYQPTEADLAASDWMVFQRFDIPYIDLRESTP